MLVVSTLICVTAYSFVAEIGKSEGAGSKPHFVCIAIVALYSILGWGLITGLALTAVVTVASTHIVSYAKKAFDACYNLFAKLFSVKPVVTEATAS